MSYILLGFWILSLRITHNLSNGRLASERDCLEECCKLLERCLERTLKMAEEGRARSGSRGREAAESETPDMPEGGPRCA